jgi:hypothetical protein
MNDTYINNITAPFFRHHMNFTADSRANTPRKDIKAGIITPNDQYKGHMST